MKLWWFWLWGINWFELHTNPFLEFCRKLLLKIEGFPMLLLSLKLEMLLFGTSFKKDKLSNPWEAILLLFYKRVDDRLSLRNGP